MRVFTKLGLAGALALAAIVMPGTMASSSAANSNLLPGLGSAFDQQPLLEEVRKRRHWRGRHRSRKWHRWHRRRPHAWRYHRKRRHHRRYYDRPGFYFGLGVLGGYGYNRYYDDDYYYYRSSCGTYAEKRRCARKYRSFNWHTCLYTTYSGRKRLCPYVR